MPLAQIQRIVFHEDRPVVVRHDLQKPCESRSLPVALSREAVAIPHQELRRKPRKLLHARKILEIRAERVVSLLVQEAADA